MEQETTNHEHVVKILTRDVSVKEIHAFLSNHHEIQDEIRTREALLWLADRVDELEQYKRHRETLDFRRDGEDWDAMMTRNRV